jgi:protease-4
VKNVHRQFVRAVARGRGDRLPEEKVRELADGRIYSGEQAKEAGLVDVLGTLEDAIDLAAKEGSIKGEPQVVYARAKERTWWERLLFSFFSERIEYKKRWGLRYQWSPLWSHRQSATMPP